MEPALAVGHCERLSLGSQIIPARSAATTATPIAGSVSEFKKTIRVILATQIQKLIATERIPLVVRDYRRGHEPTPRRVRTPSALPIPSLGALSVKPRIKSLNV